MSKKLGDLVRYYRKQKGLSQEELGMAIGHSGKTSISKIERGVNDANTKTIVKIASVLGVDPVVFIEQFSADNYTEFHEYLPYLARASEDNIRTIRFVLGMPEKKPSSDSTKATG